MPAAAWARKAVGRTRSGWRRPPRGRLACDDRDGQRTNQAVGNRTPSKVAPWKWKTRHLQKETTYLLGKSVLPRPYLPPWWGQTASRRPSRRDRTADWKIRSCTSKEHLRSPSHATRKAPGA